MLRPWILVLALAWCCGAQSPPVPVISSTSSEVLVDFVARDKHGHIVRDLRPEEVHVFENDVRQQMRALTFFDTGARLEPQSQPAAAGSSPMAGSPRKWQELRNMSVITAVFAGPLDARENGAVGAVARDLMSDVLTSEMRANTLVGVFTLERGSLRAVLPYTNDAAEVGPALVAAVENPTGRPVKGALSEPAQGATQAPLSPALRAAVDRILVRLMRPEMVEDDDTRGAIESMFASLHNSTISAPARPEGTTESESQLLALLHMMQAQMEFPGRKLLLYIGSGLKVDAQFKELLRAIVAAANRAGVTLCGVDLSPLIKPELARAHSLLMAATKASHDQSLAPSDAPVKRDWVLAPETAEQSLHADPTMNLENLAHETGGEFIGRTNDLRTPMRRELEDVRSHWELTYTPADLREDGRFRSLKVAVSRPGVTVTARSGYYALPLLNGEQIALFEYAPLMALNARRAPRDLEFHSEAVRFRPGPRAQYAMVFEAPLRAAAIEKDQDAKTKLVTAHLSFLALLKAADGRVVDRVSRDQVFQATGEAALRSQTATFAAPLFVPSGRYTLESAVVDRNSGKASTRRAVLVVESGVGLALSDLSLVRRLEPITSTASGRDPLIVRMSRVIPQVLTTARLGEDLGFYAVVYPDARSAETMAVTLELRQDGQVVTSKQFGPLTSRLGAQPMLTTLPLQGLKAGQYEARLTVRQGQASRQKELPVTLVE
jgi:VWFA-related protein